MTRTATLRAVCLAPGEPAPLLPGGFGRGGEVAWQTRTVDAFLAEVDAGADLPDFVLACDGARVAALLRRHERCALLPILAFGPAGAEIPAACDAVVPQWEPRLADFVRGRRASPTAIPRAARDSETRARRFAAWLDAAGGGRAADAEAFGLDAPHTLLAEWERRGFVRPVGNGVWSAQPGLAALARGASEADGPRPAAAPIPTPRDAAASVLPARAKRWRIGWALALLASFVALLAQGGVRLGLGTREGPGGGRSRTDLVIGRIAGPASESARGTSEAATPPPQPPPSQTESARAWVYASAMVLPALEELPAPCAGILRPRQPAGGGFAAGAELATILAVRDEGGATAGASHEALEERLARAEQRYENARRRAAAGAIAWREAAPDWEALEAARAALAAHDAASSRMPAASGVAESLRAPRPGTGLVWLLPAGAAVASGDPLLHYRNGDSWLDLVLAADEAPAADAAVEARLGGVGAAWVPVRRISAEPDGGGGLRLRYLAPGASAALPSTAELRW